MRLVHTGIFISPEDFIRLSTCSLDPCASKFGPRKRKEPWEELQEIAKEHGLPLIEDNYGLTKDGEIVFRKG